MSPESDYFQHQNQPGCEDCQSQVVVYLSNFNKLNILTLNLCESNALRTKEEYHSNCYNRGIISEEKTSCRFLQVSAH